MNGRDEIKLKNTIASMPGALGCVADVSIPEKAENLINFVKTNLKSLDILVCNVGSGKSVSPLKETYYEWQRSFALFMVRNKFNAIFC